MAIRTGDIVKYKTDPTRYGALRVIHVNGDTATCVYYQFGQNGRKNAEGLIQLEVSLPLKELVVMIKKPK